MMERIVYLDRSALRTAVRRPAFEHEWVEHPTSRPEEVEARLKSATIAITHRVFLKGENLPPTLRLIAVGSQATNASTWRHVGRAGSTSAMSEAGAPLFRSTFSPWRSRCGGTSLPTTRRFKAVRGRHPPISPW
jgi:hypothetical protein